MTSYFALVDCGSLSDPANGLVTVTTTTLGSTANYSCSSTYQIVGNALRTCQDDGAWSGDVPRCAATQVLMTDTITGSVVAVLVTMLFFILILVVGCMLYYWKRAKVQPPSYYREPVAFGLRR